MRTCLLCSYLSFVFNSERENTEYNRMARKPFVGGSARPRTAKVGHEFIETAISSPEAIKFLVVSMPANFEHLRRIRPISKFDEFKFGGRPSLRDHDFKFESNLTRTVRLLGTDPGRKISNVTRPASRPGRFSAGWQRRAANTGPGVAA
jgi:hypothetical protein